ncbi:outer membrane beta-barrel family protein [Ulvibacterium marinum]|nr:outer membrane beta-barrel family protein [Ulvibacterium marinum]
MQNYSNAQAINSITGNVINSKNKVLLGNALIISPMDSTIVKGTSFFEGIFELTDLKEKRVLLKLTSLEFVDTYITVEYKGISEINLGNIIVAEANNELQEVVVIAKTPLVKERADGSIEVKVANTTLATSTSVIEILSRSPSIVTDEDNGVEVFGKGAAVIYVNGIKVANERLSTLSPSNIESIEIISNPGPRYDAEGNAVINIITKRTMDEGSKGTVKNYYSYSGFAGYDNRTNVDYNYSKGKWSVNGNYGLLIGNDRWSWRTSRTRDTTEDFFMSDIKADSRSKMENFSNYGLGLQFNATENSYLSLEYNGAFEDLGGTRLSENTITDNEIGIYTSKLSRDDSTLKNTLNLNYYNKIDSLGSNLFVGGQFSGYNNDFDNDIDESNSIDGIESNGLINNIGENNINIFSLQSDYTKAIENSHLLELGIKYGYVNINSETLFFDIDNIRAPVKNEVLSSNFEYDEKVPAAYINYKGSISDSVNYSFGLRTELTDIKLFTSVDGGEIIEDNYINFFPNASINARLSGGLSAYLTYSSRIIRPPYNRLNPFVVYQDAFTSVRGNRDLQPSKVHSIELGWAFKNWSLKTGYNYTIGPITGGAFQSEDNPREYILQQVNVSKEHALFATLSKNINLKWLKSINNLSWSYNKLVDDTGTFDISVSRPYYYAYSQNTFDIQDWFTLYVTAWYLSDMQDGIKLRKGQSSVNIGLEKKMFNNAFTFNLDFNDIFYDVMYDGGYRIGTTDVIYANQLNTNYVRLSASYNFGKLKESKYNNKNVGETENKRVQ